MHKITQNGKEVKIVFWVLLSGFIVSISLFIFYGGGEKDAAHLGRLEHDSNSVRKTRVKREVSVEKQLVRRAEREGHETNLLVKAIQKSVQEKNRGELAILLNRVGEEEFKTVWKLLEGINNEAATNELKNRLLVHMGSMANTQNLVNTIHDLAGPGAVRNSFIKTIFAASSMTVSELVVIASTLKDPKELHSAYEGVGRKISYMPSLGMLNIGECKGDIPHEMVETLVFGLGNYHSSGLLRGDNLSYRDRAIEAIGYANTLVTQEIVDHEFIPKLISEMAKNMPFSVWEALNSSFPNLVADGQISSALLKKMASERPMETMKLAATNGMLDANIVQLALASDGVQVKDWFEQNLSKLSSKQKDAFAAGFSAQRSENGDFVGAREAIKKIQDPVLQKKANSEVWQDEKSQLQGMVTKDPAGTVQTIVSGQSKYDDYWLEEAMGTWVTKDFNGAQEWYQQNWKTLPAKKAQYVAAAFAGQAVKQGDLASARQWASYIQNPKTKQRIDAGIAKAAGLGGN